jgi:hypothetical protein
MPGFTLDQEQVLNDERIRRTQDECIAICRDVWRTGNPPPRSDPAALAEDIDRFAVGAFHYLHTNHPSTKHAQPFDLWLIVFASILEAKTHPTPLVNEAIELLRSKYRNR